MADTENTDPALRRVYIPSGEELFLNPSSSSQPGTGGTGAELFPGATPIDPNTPIDKPIDTEEPAADLDPLFSELKQGPGVGPWWGEMREDLSKVKPRITLPDLPPLVQGEVPDDALDPSVRTDVEPSIGKRAVYDLLSTPDAQQAYLDKHYPPPVDRLGRSIQDPDTGAVVPGWYFDEGMQRTLIYQHPDQSHPGGSWSYWDSPLATPADLGDLTAELGLVGGSIAGAMLGGPASAPVGQSLVAATGRALWQATMAAAGGQAVSGGLEIGAKKSEDLPIDYNEMFDRRSREFMYDFLADIGFAGLLGGGRKLSRFGAAPRHIPAASKHERAIKEVWDTTEARFGVAIPRPLWSVSPMLKAWSGFAEKIPFAGRPVKKQILGYDALTTSLQQRLLGRAPDDAVLGREVVDEYEKLWRTAQERAESIRREAQAQLRGRAHRSVSQVAADAQVMPIAQAQQNLRVGIYARKQLFMEQAEDLYAPIRAALGDSPVFDINPFIARLLRKKAMLPQRHGNIVDDVAVMDPQSMVSPGATGRPAKFEDLPIEDIAGEGPSGVAREYVPNWLMKWIDGADALDNKMTLGQVRDLRRNIDNHIESGVAIAGLDTKFLSELSGDLSRVLDDGMKAQDPMLYIMHKNANKFYSEGRKAFFEPGVARLFKRIDEAGYVEDSKILQPYIDSGRIEVIQRFKQLLGAESMEWKSLRASLMNDWIARSSTIYEEGLTGSLNGKQLVDEITRIGKSNPKMLDEILGDQKDEFVNVARMIRAGEGKIDGRILDQMGGDVSASGLRRALEAQRKLADDLETEVIRPFLRGVTDEGQIERNAEYIVQTLVNPRHAPAMKQVLRKVSPELREKLQKRAMQNVVSEAMVPLTPESAVQAVVSGPRVASGLHMLDRLGINEPTGRLAKDMKEILGPSNYRNLQDFALLITSGERTGDIAGSLARGAVFGAVMKPLKKSGPIRGLLKKVAGWALAGAVLPRIIVGLTHSQRPKGGFVEWVSREFTPHLPKTFRLVTRSQGATVREVLATEFNDDPALQQRVLQSWDESVSELAFTKIGLPPSPRSLWEGRINGGDATMPVDPPTGPAMPNDPRTSQVGQTPVPQQMGQTPVPQPGVTPVPQQMGMTPVPQQMGQTPVPQQMGMTPVPQPIGMTPVPQPIGMTPEVENQAPMVEPPMPPVQPTQPIQPPMKGMLESQGRGPAEDLWYQTAGDVEAPVGFGKKLSKYIKRNEGGFRAKGYPDKGGVSVGFGSFGRVALGETITLEQGEAWFREDVVEALRTIDRLVQIPLDPNQTIALADLLYNAGETGRTEGSVGFAVSEALKALNAGDIERFLYHAFDPEVGFVKAQDETTGKLVTSSVLVKRRADAAKLFKTPYEETGVGSAIATGR